MLVLYGRGYMGLEEEIFKEFFNKLEKNDEFPDIVLNDLKSKYEKNNLHSKDKIIEAIRLGDSDEN